MKINISRQNIYLMALSILLLIFVFVFSFAVLIPEGKEYRKQRNELKKERIELIRYQNFNDETLRHLKDLQGKNRHTILAFDNSFNPAKFEQKHKKYFTSLSIYKDVNLSKEDTFHVYEVNTTSKMDSPRGFYDFLESLNKTDWIIEVNFPIHFKREKELIKSSFTMKVYKIQKRDALQLLGK